MNLLLLAFQTVITGANLAQPIPPTDYSCRLEAVDGARFTLSGRTPPFPVGFDANASLPAQIGGEGMPELIGEARISPGHASDYFREFQLSTYRPGGRHYRVSLMLRRDGTSVAYATIFVENDRRIPYDYLAAGLCTSNFDSAG